MDQDSIGAAAGTFGRDVAGIVDKVHVVATDALHRIGTAPAIDDVGACIAYDRLLKRHCPSGSIGALPATFVVVRSSTWEPAVRV